MADVLEVIYRIAQLRGISKEQLEEIRIKKSEKRGGFEKNIFDQENKPAKENWIYANYDSKNSSVKHYASIKEV